MPDHNSRIRIVLILVILLSWSHVEAVWPDADTAVIYVLDVSQSSTSTRALVTPSCGNPQAGATPILPEFVSVEDGSVSSVRLHCSIQALLNLNQQAIDFGYVKQTGIVYFPDATWSPESGAARFALNRLLVSPDEADAQGRNLFETAARSVSQRLDGRDAHIELPLRSDRSRPINCSYLCAAARLARAARQDPQIDRTMIVLITDDYNRFRGSHLNQMAAATVGLVPEVHVFSFDNDPQRGGNFCSYGFESWDKIALASGGSCNFVLDTDLPGIRLPERFAWDVERDFLSDATGVESFALDVNVHRHVVGAVQHAGGFNHATLWRSGGVETIDLHPSGTDNSEAIAINSSGKVLINTRTGSSRHTHVIAPVDSDGDGVAETWIRDANGDGINDLLTTLPSLGGNTLDGVGLSESGTVIGQGRLASGETHAFVWQETTGISDLGTLGGTRSEAAGITSFSFGTQVEEIGLVEASRATGDSVQTFANPINDQWYVDGNGDGINDAFFPLNISPPDGFADLNFASLRRLVRSSSQLPVAMVGEASRIVSTSPLAIESVPYFWSEDRGLIRIGNPGGLRGVARDITASGVVTGGAEDANGIGRPYLWSEPAGRIDIGRLSNSRGTAFAATSRADTVVGFSRNANGVNQAAAWTIRNTAVGQNTKVVDPVTGGELRFENTLTAGTTSIEASTDNPGPGLPDPNFVFITPDNQALYYNITTTATFSGSVTVCIPYDDEVSSSPVAYHLVDGQWQPLNAFYTFGGGFVDGSRLPGSAICFVTDSFSWFAVGVNSEVPSADAGPLQTAACTSSRGAVVTLDGSGSRDPNGGPLTYYWTGPFGNATGIAPSVQVPVGISAVSLVVSDGVNQSVPATTSAAVYVEAVGLEPPFAGLTTVDREQPALPSHSFKAGRTLPMRLRLLCGIEELTDSHVVAPRIAGITRTGAALDLGAFDLDSGSTASSTPNFRYENGYWVYNLSTREMTPGTYQVDIELPDGSLSSAAFVLR